MNRSRACSLASSLDRLIYMKRPDASDQLARTMSTRAIRLEEGNHSSTKQQDSTGDCLAGSVRTFASHRGAPTKPRSVLLFFPSPIACLPSPVRLCGCRRPRALPSRLALALARSPKSKSHAQPARGSFYPLCIYRQKIQAKSFRSNSKAA
jgi:hypothetical protein